MRFKRFVCLITMCALLLASCGAGAQTLTEAESAAFSRLGDIAGAKDVTAQFIAEGRAKKFPAVKKAFEKDGLMAVVAEPVAYNGPMTLAVLIDEGAQALVGMEIAAEMETPEYVRNYTDGWFEQRFAGKSVFSPLAVSKLEAVNEYDIIAITGATVTTDAACLGVNAAMGAYIEYSGIGEAAAVPLAAEQE